MDKKSYSQSTVKSASIEKQDLFDSTTVSIAVAILVIVLSIGMFGNILTIHFLINELLFLFSFLLAKQENNT